MPFSCLSFNDANIHFNDSNVDFDTSFLLNNLINKSKRANEFQLQQNNQDFLMNLIAGAIQYISSFLTVCFMGNKLSDDQSKGSLEQNFY